jgi:hypothetical protein
MSRPITKPSGSKIPQVSVADALKRLFELYLPSMKLYETKLIQEANNANLNGTILFLQAEKMFSNGKGEPNIELLPSSKEYQFLKSMERKYAADIEGDMTRMLFLERKKVTGPVTKPVTGAVATPVTINRDREMQAFLEARRRQQEQAFLVNYQKELKQRMKAYHGVTDVVDDTNVLPPENFEEDDTTINIREVKKPKDDDDDDDNDDDDDDDKSSTSSRQDNESDAGGSDYGDESGLIDRYGGYGEDDYEGVNYGYDDEDDNKKDSYWDDGINIAYDEGYDD